MRQPPESKGDDVDKERSQYSFQHRTTPMSKIRKVRNERTPSFVT